MRAWTNLTLRLRLEDLIALTFFLINLGVLAIFRERGKQEFSPAAQMGAIAVLVLMLKELFQQALNTREYHLQSRSDRREFARTYWQIVRDWVPFLMILLMYYSLWGDATHLLVRQDRDATLIAWDQRLFGCQPSVALQSFVTPPLTAWMSFAYGFHVFHVPLVACFIYLRRPRENFRNMMCGLITISFFGFLGYLLVPAVGPMYALKDHFTVPLLQPHGLIGRESEFMDIARIKRDVFPSLHVGISFLVWLYAWKNSPPLSWILAPFVLSLWVSTVYLRYHYLVDCIAGAILAPLCFWLANWMFKHFGELRFRLLLPKVRMRDPGRDVA